MHVDIRRRLGISECHSLRRCFAVRDNPVVRFELSHVHTAYQPLHANDHSPSPHALMAPSRPLKQFSRTLLTILRQSHEVEPAAGRLPPEIVNHILSFVSAEFHDEQANVFFLCVHQPEVSLD